MNRAAVETAINCRRCRRCNSPLRPPQQVEIHLEDVQLLIAALIAGFCSTMCMASDAIDAVATGTAWWMPPQLVRDVAVGEEKPRPGERCRCGRPAMTVFITKKFGRVGYCGIPDGGGDRSRGGDSR